MDSSTSTKHDSLHIPLPSQSPKTQALASMATPSQMETPSPSYSFALSSRPSTSCTLISELPASRDTRTAGSMTPFMDPEKITAKQEEQWTPQKNEWFIMISMSIISLMVALDATILVTVLPEVAVSLHGTSVDAFWAGTSYLLSSAVFQPIIASVSEMFGRQQLLLFSLTSFTIGTILCAAAKDFTVLLTGRSIQGIGGGGIITLSQVIFCDIIPLRQRPKYFNVVLGAWSVGTIIGPVVGGAFVEKANWRWAFIINFPICFLGFILAIFFVRLNTVAKLTLAQKLRNTDWLGAALFLGGTTSFLVGLSWGGVQFPWASAQTLAPIIVGLAAVAGFVGWQLYIKPKSLLPMTIFYCPSALLAFYCALANGLLLFTTLYYFPFYYMSVRGSSPTRAGVECIPTLALLVPGSIIVGALITRLGRFRWAIWIGWATVTLGCGLTLLFDLHTSWAAIYTILGVFGVGSGMVITSVNVGIQAISRLEDCAMSASMYGFFRSLGMPLGVALSGTIFQNAMSSKLASYNLPKTIAHDSERYIFVLRTMALDDPKRVPVLESYMHGFHSVFILMTGVAASAFAASLFIRKFSMDKQLYSKFSAR